MLYEVITIHEYQAREIFRKHGLPVPNHVLCHSVAEVKEAVENLDRLVVVKAQVLVGGRGKAGGVKLARTAEDAVITSYSIHYTKLYDSVGWCSNQGSIATIETHQQRARPVGTTVARRSPPGHYPFV